MTFIADAHADAAYKRIELMTHDKSNRQSSTLSRKLLSVILFNYLIDNTEIPLYQNRNSSNGKVRVS